MYQLKKGVESFEVVDGPMAGRKFFRGQTYKEIPPGEEKKFEKIQPRGQSATQPADKKEDKAESSKLKAES